ncbi:MAG: hypothetical protein JSS66_06820 [Armatimonadetes bacterium]|nr:hypothetical protein [Armatimonadota bacterium]
MPHPTTPENMAAAAEVVKELVNSPYWDRLRKKNTTVSELCAALGTTVYQMLGLWPGSLEQEPDAGEALTSLFNSIVPGAFD